MTKPKSGAEAIRWFHHQIDHPSKDWTHLCQSSVRTSLGLPAWSPSARKAFEATPDREVHRVHHWQEVPPGAIMYGLLDHTYGHAWLAGHKGHGFSIDYKRRGKIDRVPLLLPHWTHNQGVYWSTWTPFGHIDVDVDDAWWPHYHDKHFPHHHEHKG
jgi:hypothetical protein